MVRSNRQKIVRCDPRLVIEMLNGFQHGKFLRLPVTPEIPEDVEIVAVISDHWSRCLELLIQHPSFDEVPEGEVIPRVVDFIESRVLRRQWLTGESAEDGWGSDAAVAEHESTPEAIEAARDELEFFFGKE